MSADYFLGIPFNIAEAALLLEIVARLTGYKATWLTITTNDSHIYENAIAATKELLTREPYPLPTLHINDAMPTFNHLFEQYENALHTVESHWTEKELLVETADGAVEQLAILDPSWFALEGYQCHDAIRVDMAV